MLFIALAAALASDAAALDLPTSPEPPTNVLLACTGTEKAVEQTGTTTTVIMKPGIDPGVGPIQHRSAVIASTAKTTTETEPVYSAVRIPARMSIALEGGAAKIRPPRNNGPRIGQKKSPDGWYPLSDVSVSQTQIVGRASFGTLLGGRYKLSVDRITGEVTFGDFAGVCEKVSSSPQERRF